MSKFYKVWNEDDPNDSFEVEAQDSEQAAYFALSELGWAIGAEPRDSEEKDYCLN